MLQNLAIKTIVRIGDNSDSVPTYCIKHVESHTASDSPLRKYFIELVGGSLSADAIKESSGNYPQGFLLDLVIYLAGKYSSDYEDKLDVSNFLVAVGVDEKKG